MVYCDVTVSMATRLWGKEGDIEKWARIDEQEEKLVWRQPFGLSPGTELKLSLLITAKLHKTRRPALLKNSFNESCLFLSQFLGMLFFYFSSMYLIYCVYKHVV